MGKEIWFFHRLGPTGSSWLQLRSAEIATIGGIWVTTAAISVYAHPLDNLPYTVLVILLYLLFNGLLIGLCCAAALSILKFICVANSALYRLLHALLLQPIRLARFVSECFAALIDMFRAIRRRLSR